NPRFAADEFTKLKARLKTGLIQQRTQPGFLAEERFRRAIYGSHPAATYSTTVAALDALTPEMLAAWHREHYVPQNAILGIAGDVKAAAVIANLKQWLGDWKKTDYMENLPANPAPATTARIYLIDRPNSVQSTITMG